MRNPRKKNNGGFNIFMTTEQADENHLKAPKHLLNLFSKVNNEHFLMLLMLKNKHYYIHLPCAVT